MLIGHDPLGCLLRHRPRRAITDIPVGREITGKFTEADMTDHTVVGMLTTGRRPKLDGFPIQVTVGLTTDHTELSGGFVQIVLTDHKLQVTLISH